MDGLRVDGRRIAGVAAGGFLLLLAAFWIAWPLGVALGVASSAAVVVLIARHQQRLSDEVPSDVLDFTGDEDLRQEFRRLRARLGDDWWQFADAAVLVTRSQWASAAGLQRELGVSTSRARHLLVLLQREGFVGPARGAQRREVLVGPEAVRDLQRMLHA